MFDAVRQGPHWAPPNSTDRTMRNSLVYGALALGLAGALGAQGTAADYARASQMNARFQGLAINVPDRATWIGKTSRFWYRRTVTGGFEFMVVDAATQDKRPAFDHAKLATALNSAANTQFTAVTLPFAELSFTSDEKAIEFAAAAFNWRCQLADYACTRLGPAPTGGRGGRGGAPSVDDPEDQPPFEGPWDEDDGLVAEVLAQRTQQQRGSQQATDTMTRRAPDGQQEAYIQNYNLYVRPVGSRVGTAVTTDGSEGGAYTIQSAAWSPDSKKIAVYRVTPGYRRLVRYVESSPADQLQPKYMERVYAKPGDVLDVREPVLVDLETKQSVRVEQRALSERVSDAAAHVATRQSRVHVRVQPARTSGVSRDRGRCRARDAARGDLGRAEDVLQLPHGERWSFRFRKALPLRHRRRQRDRLDVGARRVEPPLSVRRRDRQGEEPDHEGAVGGARRREGRHDARQIMVPRQRDESQAGSVFHTLLSDQLRRHRSHGAHRRRRHARAHLVGRQHVLRSTPGLASICAPVLAAPQSERSEDAHGSRARQTSPR